MVPLKYYNCFSVKDTEESIKLAFIMYFKAISLYSDENEYKIPTQMRVQ